MEIELYRVDDDLEAYLEFNEILKINRSKDPDRKAHGSLEIKFKETDDREVPFSEQLAALEYFNENQQSILASIAEAFFQEREDFEEVFGSFSEESS